VARGYQQGFYTSSRRVRDAASRATLAKKITFVLAPHLTAARGRGVCLDIGCASGEITAHLASLFGLSVGVEYDPEAITAVPHSARAQAVFLRGDGMALPLAATSVDAIVCAQVYEHVPDDRRLFGEMERVLKPGGLVFFSGPNWLFPIEPHYGIPGLHWLPIRLADFLLRAGRHGDHYYERSRTYWDLRRKLSAFTIQDLGPSVLRFYLRRTRGLLALGQRLPGWMLGPILPFLPNFNWLLRKRE
jgi:SAM-dependent methyltransferase